MDVLVLAAKSGLALMLVVAGAAKLAEVSSFAATVQVFTPISTSARITESLASALATLEVLLGGTSLAFPSIAAVNWLVLAAGCAFLTVSLIGYLRHRGMSCRCFGQLSNRTFDAAGVMRSLVIVGLAAGVAVSSVPQTAIQLVTVDHLLLLGGAVLVALATYTAARGTAMTNEVEPL